MLIWHADRAGLVPRTNAITWPIQSNSAVIPGLLQRNKACHFPRVRSTMSNAQAVAESQFVNSSNAEA